MDIFRATNHLIEHIIGLHGAHNPFVCLAEYVYHLLLQDYVRGLGGSVFSEYVFCAVRLVEVLCECRFQSP